MKKFGSDPKLLKRERCSAIPALIFLVIFFFILFFNVTYQRIYVVGSSMENTLFGALNDKPYSKGGDFVYIFKAMPQRGDIVVIDVDGKSIIKRVVAVGGDRVKLVQGKLFLNGVEVNEPYVADENNSPELNNFDEVFVENCYVFFLGDNRNVSNDSRAYGCVSVKQVVGVVADWSLTYKSTVTAINEFFQFTLPSWFN